MKRSKKLLGLVAACATSLLAGAIAAPHSASAAVKQSCRTIKLANIGWSDNEIQNAIFTNLVTSLGYKVKTNLYSEEVTYAGLKNGQLDVFLDDWTPSMNKITEPYEKKHQIDVMGPDLTGAKYTLAVPAYLYKEGLKTFGDIHKFAKQLNHKIYGIEPGNDGNEHILAMIKDHKYDLGNFHLVQSSEAGMLSEVSRKYKHKKPVVFLAWEPHPMNIEFKLKYLKGGAHYFGPHEGAATIYINTRHGYAKDCPNVGKLLSNFKLDVKEESKMMYATDVKSDKASKVAARWLKAHPAWVKQTLAGVTTVDGKKAAPVVEKALKSS